MFAHRLNAGNISPPSRSFPNWGIVSQPFPSPISRYPRLKMSISTQSRSFSTPYRFRDLCLISIRAPWFIRFTFFPCLSWISPQSMSVYLHLPYIQQHLTSIHVCHISYQFSPSINSNTLRLKDVSLTPIQVLSQMKNCISGPSQSHITLPTSQDVHLNLIHDPSQPHPGREIFISSPSRLSDSHFFFVSVESHLNPGPYICISPTPRQHLSSRQVHQIAS